MNAESSKDSEEIAASEELVPGSLKHTALWERVQDTLRRRYRYLLPEYCVYGLAGVHLGGIFSHEFSRWHSSSISAEGELPIWIAMILITLCVMIYIIQLAPTQLKRKLKKDKHTALSHLRAFMGMKNLLFYWFFAGYVTYLLLDYQGVAGIYQVVGLYSITIAALLYSLQSRKTNYINLVVSDFVRLEDNKHRHIDSINQAERSLDRAGDLFESRSFIPFWECQGETKALFHKVEKCEKQAVVVFDRCKVHVAIHGLKESPESFDPGTEVWKPKLTYMESKLEDLISDALKDHEFSVIYMQMKEQQKLNQIQKDLHDSNVTLRRELEETKNEATAAHQAAKKSISASKAARSAASRAARQAKEAKNTARNTSNQY